MSPGARLELKKRKERSFKPDGGKGIKVWMVFALMAQTDHFYIKVVLE